MKSNKDLAGQRFGKLTALQPTEQRKYNNIVWECQCDCGNTAMVPRSSLVNNQIKSCGCDRYKPEKLIGKQFGQLLVIKMSDITDKNGRTMWECLCDCGKTTTAARAYLVKGVTKSCRSCAHEKRMKNLTWCCERYKQYEDLNRLRFGRLTVIKLSDKKINGRKVWECLCDCGNTTYVRATYLMRGVIKSCGCLFIEARSEYSQKVCIEGTCLTNICRKPRIDNTSGTVGVSYVPKNDSWAAYITFKGKSHWLGRYKEKEDAINARKAAEAMHTEFLERHKHLLISDTSEAFSK